MYRTILAALLSLGLMVVWTSRDAEACDKCKGKEGEKCEGKADCKCKEGEKCDCKADCKCKEGEKCDCAKKAEGTCPMAGKAEAAPAVAKDMIGKEAVCPVSGEKFTIKEGTTFSEYKGQTYYFCCPGCKPKFDKDPEQFLKKPAAK